MQADCAEEEADPPRGFTELLMEVSGDNSPPEKRATEKHMSDCSIMEMLPQRPGTVQEQDSETSKEEAAPQENNRGRLMRCEESLRSLEQQRLEMQGLMRGWLDELDRSQRQQLQLQQLLAEAVGPGEHCKHSPGPRCLEHCAFPASEPNSARCLGGAMARIHSFEGRRGLHQMEDALYLAEKPIDERDEESCSSSGSSPAAGAHTVDALPGSVPQANKASGKASPGEESASLKRLPGKLTRALCDLEKQDAGFNGDGVSSTSTTRPPARSSAMGFMWGDSFDSVMPDEESDDQIFTLKVRILSAEGLPKGGWLDTSDPYCKCEVVNRPDTLFRTRAIRNVVAPQWNHEGVVQAFAPGETLSFSVWDADRITKDDLLGTATLDSSRILPCGWEGNLNLSGTKAAKGSIRVKVSILNRRRSNDDFDARKVSKLLKWSEDSRKVSCYRCCERFFERLGLSGWFLGYNQLSYQKRLDTLQSVSSTRMWKLIHSPAFHFFSSLAILINVALIGWQAHAALRSEIEHHEQSDVWFYVEASFFGWFTLELLMRLVGQRQFFIIGPERKWNLFDAILLLVSFIDILSLWALHQVHGLRVVRLARLVRVFRLVRVMRAFHTLRLLVFSIAGSVTSLMWCFLMLLFITFLFAIFFVSGITEYLDRLEGPPDEKLVEAYGSLPQAMVTLFQTISGGVDWRDALEPLLVLDWWYEPAFLGYIFFMFFGVLNVVIGAFVATTAEIASKDRDAVIQNEMNRIETYREQIRTFFCEADKDHSGMLSWDEFEAHLQSNEVKAYFQALDLDVSQAHVVFKLLDEDASDQVGMDEFFDGCMRLKGTARSIDVNLLLYEQQKHVTKLNQFIDYCKEGFALMEDKLNICRSAEGRRSTFYRSGTSASRVGTERKAIRG
mmetsp:Transcript_66581/g.159124  ORF Transcript_66581/g.159124 Transcript_66581/m.159124 type:complete len:899 (+) Transcript_66581:70-2766(+)